MSDLVSVIIPAYNIAPYIERCVRSVLNQTYKNLEILIVDDGSTDCTLEICEQLQRSDSRVRIFHKENGGVSSARNLGLDNCKGQFISIIDGDDWIEPTLYEDAIRTIKNTNVNVFMFEYFIDQNSKSQEHSVDKSYYGKIDKSAALMHSITPNNRFIWLKVFSSELISNSCFLRPIRFDTSIILGEDTLFCEQILMGSAGVFYSDRRYYHYEQREGSAVRSAFKPEKLSGLKAYHQVKVMFEENGLSDLCIYTDEAIFNLGLSLVSEIVAKGGTAANSYISDVKGYITPIRIKLLFSRSVSRKTKIKIIMSMMSLKKTGKILGNRQKF